MTIFTPCTGSLIQRAVNVYNFHKVIVEECVFEHNGPASNIKFTNFMRGHSGGLAILLIEYHQCDVGCITVTQHAESSRELELSRVSTRGSKHAWARA